MSHSIKLAVVGYSERNPVMAPPWHGIESLTRQLHNKFADLFVGRNTVDIDQAFLAGRLTFSFFDGKIIGEFEGDFMPALEYPTVRKDSE